MWPKVLHFVQGCTDPLGFCGDRGAGYALGSGAHAGLFTFVLWRLVFCGGGGGSGGEGGGGGTISWLTGLVLTWKVSGDEGLIGTCVCL
jgi:hypothetical protein